MERNTVQKNDTFFISALLNFHGKPILQPEKFQPHEEFLAYHRENIFEKWGDSEKYRIIQDRLFESDFDRMIKLLEKKDSE